MMDDLVKRADEVMGAGSMDEFVHLACELIPAMRDRIEADAKRINILEMREVSRNAERLGALNNNAAQAQMIAKRDARIAELEAERKKDHAEINIKADFIDATLNQLAAAEARVKELKLDAYTWKERALHQNKVANEQEIRAEAAEARVKVLEDVLEWLASQPEAPPFMAYRARAAFEGEK